MKIRRRPILRTVLAVVVSAAILVSHDTPSFGTGATPVLLAPSMDDLNAPEAFLSACLQMSQWADVRGNTEYLGLAEWEIAQASDGDLVQCFNNMRAHGIQLMIEVGALKPLCEGIGCYNAQEGMYNRLNNLNAPLGAIQLDEPLNTGRDNNYPDLHSANHTCDYISRVRQHPVVSANTLIIEIEPFPHFNSGQNTVTILSNWLATLQSSCAQRNTAAPNAFMVDHDWPSTQFSWTWQDIRYLREEAHAHGMLFAVNLQGGTNSTNDLEWYPRTRSYAQAIRDNFVNPDLYGLQSFVTIPHVTVPETTEHTFMWTARQLIAEGLLPGSLSSPPSSVTLHEHLDFGGATLNVSGDISDLRFVGEDWNDRATSVRVPAGKTVTLFEHIDYQGASLVLTADVGDLRDYPGPNGGTWNDAASSIWVR